MSITCRLLKVSPVLNNALLIGKERLIKHILVRRSITSNTHSKISLLQNCPSYQICRFFTSNSLLNLNLYHKVSEDTLEELAELFDELGDDGRFGSDYDLTLADGVMTIKLGVYGTYVINKQTPNRQIWLSSPVSGPKRYDFLENTWQYSHEPDMTLHKLLSHEITKFTNKETDFTHLLHGKKEENS